MGMLSTITGSYMVNKTCPPAFNMVLEKFLKQIAASRCLFSTVYKTNKAMLDGLRRLRLATVKRIQWKATSIKNCHFMTGMSCRNYRKTINGGIVSN